MTATKKSFYHHWAENRSPVLRLMKCLDLLIFSFTKHPEQSAVQVKVIIMLSCCNNQSHFEQKVPWRVMAQSAVTPKDSEQSDVIQYNCQ